MPTALSQLLVCRGTDESQQLRRKELGQVDLLPHRKATGCVPGSTEEAAGSPLVTKVWFCGKRPQTGEAVAGPSAKLQC